MGEVGFDGGEEVVGAGGGGVDEEDGAGDGGEGRWKKRLEQTGSLYDGRWDKAPKHKAPADDPMLREVRLLWMSQRGLSAQRCWETALAAAEEKGWRVCSYRTAARYLKSIPYAQRVYAQEGPKAFVAKCEPSIARDYSTTESNENWVGDHHQFDVIVQVGERVNRTTGEATPIFGRPWLSAWQDLRSRKIVGWIIRSADPNTEAIIAALGNGIFSHGLPTRVYTDNGRDYRSRVLTGEPRAMRWERRTVRVKYDQAKLGGIYEGLGISRMHAWPYHPQSKPIERTFGTTADQFSRTFETYCGRDSQHKPEQLGEMLRRGKAPTLEAFTAKFAEWLDTYHGREHSGDSMGCAPAVAWEANLRTKRTASAATLEILLQPRIGPLKVGKNGVSHKGIGYGQYQLGQYQQTQVFIRVSRELGKVGVYRAPDDVWICDAFANKRLAVNADHEALAAGISEKKRESRILKGAHESRLHIADDMTDRVNRAAAIRNQSLQRSNPTPPPPPYTITPFRSDFEAQLKAREAEARPQELRRAAGAESMSPRMSLDELEAIYARE